MTWVTDTHPIEMAPYNTVKVTTRCLKNTEKAAATVAAACYHWRKCNKPSGLLNELQAPRLVIQSVLYNLNRRSRTAELEDSKLTNELTETEIF